MDGQLRKHRTSIVVIGDEKVGKTSIIVRYCMNTFSEGYSPTLCSDYYRKTVARKDLDLIADLHIWDIGGQDHYKVDREFYLKRGMVIVIIFSIDDLDSFMNLRKWIGDARTAGRKDAKIIVIGNKIDLRRVNPICITTDQLLDEAREIKCDAVLETSAKEDVNVRALFDKAIDLSKDDEPVEEIPLSSSE